MKAITAMALTICLAFTACNNAPKEEANTEAATETATEQAAAPTGPMDPVCEMAKDSTWTEYALNGADTVWFCSETCKSAFTGNPQKYQSKIKG